MFVLVSTSLVVLSGLLLLWARLLRASRRVMVARVGLLLFILSLAGMGFSLGTEFNLQFSDNLQIGSMLLSAAVGVGLTSFDRTLARMTVAIVIPSRVAFHTDLRRGLREGLKDIIVKYVDDYSEGTSSKENLSDFLPCFKKAIQNRPDFLIIASPGLKYLNDDAVLAALERMTFLGGRVFFIENGPTRLTKRALKGVTVVRSDSSAGASALAKYYIEKNWDKKSLIAFIDGPTDSHPASTRFEVLKEQIQIPEDLIIRSEMESFSETAAYEFTKMIINRAPGLIICANDSMAIGATRAVREANMDSSVKVVGYDGVPRALHAIAEPRNCFQATIRIPPAQYGIEIASQIVDDVRSGGFRRPRMVPVMIPISEANLVTAHNAEEVIGD